MATDTKKTGYDEMLGQIMSKMEALEANLSTMQLEVSNANLRAENAELKMSANLSWANASNKPSMKPLGRGKNRSNRWLDEMVSYTPPRSYDQKDLYFDVGYNGKTWRLIRSKPNRIPRAVQLIAVERVKREDALSAKINGMVEEFENASSNDFKDNNFVQNRIR